MSIAPATIVGHTGSSGDCWTGCMLTGVHKAAHWSTSSGCCNNQCYSPLQRHCTCTPQRPHMHAFPPTTGCRNSSEAAPSTPIAAAEVATWAASIICTTLCAHTTKPWRRRAGERGSTLRGHIYTPLEEMSIASSAEVGYASGSGDTWTHSI